MKWRLYCLEIEDCAFCLSYLFLPIILYWNFDTEITFLKIDPDQTSSMRLSLSPTATLQKWKRIHPYYWGKGGA